MAVKHKTENLYTVKSNTEKKRIRLRLGKGKDEVLKTFLICWPCKWTPMSSFCRLNVPADNRKEVGLHAAFKSVFPITSYSGHAKLEYVGYSLGEPVFDVQECRLRGATFAAPLRVKMRLVYLIKKNLRIIPLLKILKNRKFSWVKSH